MNTTVMLIISLAAALFGNIIKKYYTKNTDENENFNSVLIFNIISLSAAAIILFIWEGFSDPSVFTAVFGVIFGIMTAVSGIASLEALKFGPMSYTSVIISFSTLLTALSGALFFDENISSVQEIGIICMLISFLLAAKKDSSSKKTSVKWFSLCITAFFSTGGIGIMQKAHQNSIHKSELNELLIIAFISSAIFCAVTVFIQNKMTSCAKVKKNNIQKAMPKKERIIFIAIVFMNGVCVAINNKFNLYLSGVMDSAIFFPTVNGGGLMLTTLSAIMLFKEKLTKKQWVGLIFGIISVILLCNPFK